jgi:hypothetical protein
MNVMLTIAENHADDPDDHRRESPAASTKVPATAENAWTEIGERYRAAARRW